MPHFAKLDDNNVVTQVIVIDNNDCDGGDFTASETAGQTFIASIGLDGTWKQTSYNANFRSRFAGLNYTYNETDDAFVRPQPYPSWTYNSETTDWDAPVAYPDDGTLYKWNEDDQAWEPSPDT